MNLLEQLSKKAFWDVDMKTMDAEKHADYIIQKVFEYGSLNDVKQVLYFYPSDKIIQSLTTANFLFKETLHFASMLFHIPKESFSCYTKTQLQMNAGTCFRN